MCHLVLLQLQPSGPAALQEHGTATRETPVCHRGDRGLRTGVSERVGGQRRGHVQGHSSHPLIDDGDDEDVRAGQIPWFTP